MCNLCGCGQGETRIEGKPDATAEAPAHLHGHRHDHTHAHAHEHRHGHALSEMHDGEHDPTHLHDVHSAQYATHAHEHGHGHRHDHGHGAHDDLHYGRGAAHAHAPGLSQTRMLRIERDILASNNAYASDNRRWFVAHGVFAVNLVSSPGSGKTTLLVRTIEALRDALRIAVIEGDQQTTHDADRIRATGARALQINTGKGCHLDATMLGHALEHLHPEDDSLLLIENVGNLVCPASFDLGEAHKVVVLSVTEGEDKPLKYSDMFHAADLMLLNKIDLLPHVRFDVEQCVAYAQQVKPGLQVLQVSAQSGAGMEAWLDWLQRGVGAAREQRRQTIDTLQRRIAELEMQLASKA